jgi:putative acetyltransferase
MIFEVRSLDDLSGPEVAALIAEHLAGMTGASPPGAVHAAGCGGPAQASRPPSGRSGRAISSADAARSRPSVATAGEIKSMRTRPAFLRQGVGQAGRTEIIRSGAGSGATASLFLETGTAEAFAGRALRFICVTALNGGRAPFADYGRHRLKRSLCKSVSVRSDRGAAVALAITAAARGRLHQEAQRSWTPPGVSSAEAGFGAVAAGRAILSGMGVGSRCNRLDKECALCKPNQKWVLCFRK